MIDLAARKRTADAGAEQQKKVEPEFGKEQILASERYKGERDLVDALLDEKRKYTLETVDRMIETYQKGQVK